MKKALIILLQAVSLPFAVVLVIATIVISFTNLAEEALGAKKEGDCETG